MYNNGMNYGAMGMMGGQMGTSYAQQRNINMTQALTPEEIAKLQKKEVGPTQITEKEELEAYCTHKDPNTNRLAVVDKGNGNFYCHICGQEFPELDITMDQAQQIVDDFVALLQNTKLFYLDIPQNFVRQFFKIMPLARKVPQLYANAMKNFRDHEGGMGVNYNPNMYAANVLNAIVGPGMGNPMMGQMNGQMMNQQMMTGQPMGNPMMGQPMNGQMMNQQMMTGQPMGNPMMGQPMNMNSQMMNQQPMMNAQNPFFSNGGASTQQQAPTQPAEGKNIEHRVAQLSV